MNITQAFYELDDIYEDFDNYANRQQLIDKIKNTKSGKYYNLTKYSTKQLSAILVNCLHKDSQMSKNEKDFQRKENQKLCAECGIMLSDNGTCPRCDADFGLGDAFDA